MPVANHSLADDPLLNPDLQQCPDSTSITAAGAMGIVGSLVSLGTTGAGTLSRQAHTFGQTTIPGDPINFFRWAQTTAATAGTPKWTHKVENVRTFASRKVTLSGYYRSNVAIDIKLRQDFGAGGSPSADVLTVGNGLATLPVTTDADGTAQWKPFSISYNLPSLSGKTLGTTVGTHYLGVDFLPPISVTFQFDYCRLRLVEGGQSDPTTSRRVAQEDEDVLARYYKIYLLTGTGASVPQCFARRMVITPAVTVSAGTTSNATTDSAHFNHTVNVAVSMTADGRIAD